ncbi:AAA family ATPase [Parachitinimonas caeni]|uniref:AAA family ATPase n=1 Tax=Parachitinimonas caeni TaxID=3031301 RepID=A0ABT7DYH5_9NEIS|nr:AAA family ATPase [Parachitinimonas caeni]MDK2125105.1 AAA family ATPase [Parachitinimonas caeni]
MKAIILAGIQASGKSSFCRQQFFDTHIRLNLDMLRTRRREAILLEACLAAQQPVLIDNTNPHSDDRRRYLNVLRAARYQVDCYYFPPDIDGCLARNAGRDGKACIPDVAILGTVSKWQTPSFAEGFDHLYTVKLLEGTFVVDEVMREI